MTDDSRPSVTEVLEAVSAGKREAGAALLPLVYDELRQLARARMARVPPGQTLQATALVHEAFLRVAGNHGAQWDGRHHFFGAAAQAMRDILVEQARRRASLKRGGDRKRVDMAAIEPVIEPPSEDVLALDEALTRLESEDPRKGRIVMLRYFAGLTVAETAAAMDLSVGTIEREWRYIKTWLFAQLHDKPRGAEEM